MNKKPCQCPNCGTELKFYGICLPELRCLKCNYAYLGPDATKHLSSPDELLEAFRNQYREDGQWLTLPKNK